MISRTSFQLLLLVNLLLLGVWVAPTLGIQILDDGGREPERMSNQLHPEQVHVLREAETQEAPAAPATPPASGAASAPQATAATAPAAAACIQLAALTSDQVAAVNDALKPLGNALSMREEDTTTTSYWVNIPPNGGKAGAEKRTNDLKQLGIQDFFVVKDAGSDQFAVSLGLYHNEAAAQRMLESLQKKGIRTARITTRESVSSSRMRLSGPSDVLDRLTHDLGDKLKGVEQTACSPT